jgi:curved DNA-binding protein CbpA
MPVGIAPVGPAAAASTPPASPSVPRPAPTAAPSTSGATIPPAGELSKTSAIHLYYLAAAGDQTGLFRFKLADRAIDVHFRKGNPEYIASSHPEDSLAGFLLAQNLVTPAQIAQAEAEKERGFGGELVSALFGLGILNPSSAFAQLAQRATGLLLKALYNEQGTFTFEAVELPPHRVLPLGNRWAPVLELMRRIPLPELRRRMAPWMDKPVMKSGGRVPQGELRLNAQETRALAHFDGVRSLAQLQAEVPQDGENLVRLAYALKELEAVSFGSAPAAARPVNPAPATGVAPPVNAPVAGTAAPARPAPPAGQSSVPGAPVAGPGAAAQAAPPRPAGAATPPPGAVRPGNPPGTPVPGARPPGAAPAATTAATTPPPASRPGNPPGMGTRPPMPPTAGASKPTSGSGPAPAAAAGPVNHDTELKELRARAAAQKDQNHFEVLGIPQTSDSGAVKLAYFKLAKIYHPDTIPPDAPAEFAKLKQDIFSRVGEAYRTLTDDKSRADYIEELKTGGGSVDVAAILAAEETFQKGCILVKAKKFADAVTMLDDAITNNPEEGEFYAWRGFAKFFTFPDKKKGRLEGEKDLQLALKKNARCAQAYYFLGQIAKLSGDNVAAMTQFKKTIEIQPDHIDASREVRMGAGKK